MEILGTELREDFVKSTLENLVQLFPDDPLVKDQAAMRELIEFGIARAAEYDIKRGREVSLFIFLTLDLGRDFEKQPENIWIEELLHDPELDEQEKMDLIYARLELEAGGAK